MDLTIEKELALNAKDRYDIYTFATEAADDNGFVNSFVFQRALYCYTILLLAEDEYKDQIRPLIAENLVQAWDKIIEDDILPKIIEQYPREMDMIGQEGKIWFDEYDKYAISARGILSLVEQFTNGAVVNAASSFKNAAEKSGVSEVLKIADDWGMNRRNLAPDRQERDWEEKDQESLL